MRNDKDAMWDDVRKVRETPHGSSGQDRVKS